MGDSQSTQNIQITSVIGENEKCVFYFMEKNHMDSLANPVFQVSPALEIINPLCIIVYI